MNDATQDTLQSQVEHYRSIQIDVDYTMTPDYNTDDEYTVWLEGRILFFQVVILLALLLFMFLINQLKKLTYYMNAYVFCARMCVYIYAFPLHDYF